jgi:ATP-dependent DNA helicase RecQ
LDIETPSTGAAVLHKLAAFRPDMEASLTIQRPFSASQVKAELDRLSEGAAFVLGHNVRRHDVPMLDKIIPGLALARLPVVDTLELSPLAFPQNPYHALIKQGKLVKEQRNNPLLDAKHSLQLFCDEMKAFEGLAKSQPDDLALFHYLVVSADLGGLASVFTTLRRAARPSDDEAREHLRRAISRKVCATRLRSLASNDLPDSSRHWAIAYAVAWLRVAGGNSVLPLWVHHTFPETRRLLRELREVPCTDPACGYCQEHHNPERLLKNYFNLEGFRPQPASSSGNSLQREIVLAGLRDEPLLAILPTGGGKSLCYQLPALEKFGRTGKLTVVISPLQSLMKDQVDNLVKRGVTCAVALNGLLTPPERQRNLELIRMGDAGIVLVSPEQFRNKAFANAIRWRDIGAWVFDEAHCLSRWGHDFRTDYLYVSRFIRERFGEPVAPIACFTATAKPDVITDLQEHFKSELGIALSTFAGGHQRQNLEYGVIPVRKAEKPARILELLREALREDSGGAIVFASTRANAEATAGYVRDAGWACAFFHAGLEPGTKREIQQDFIEGRLRIIVATNAFGMGVDKPDVRLVVHSDVPGSLENYLQEAGRAGRDGAPAQCVLLFDEEDIEAQFRLSARSRLTQGDFIRILKALRKRSNRVGDEKIVVTARELLLDDDGGEGIDPESPDADTKVKTAVAWLERGRYLRREENRTRVFPTSLRVESIEQARERLAKVDLPDEVRTRYLKVLEIVMRADHEKGVSTDDMLTEAGIAAADCFHTLSNLARLGLLENDLGVRAVLRKGVTNPSDALLERHGLIERTVLDLMRQAAPDAAPGETQVLTLRPLCTSAAAELGPHVPPSALVPEHVMDVLRALSHSFDDRQGPRHMFSLRKVREGELRVKLLKPWNEIQQAVEKRQAVAGVLLRSLLAKVPSSLRSANASVECKTAELSAALSADLALAPLLGDPATVLEQGLLHLHDTQVIVLDKGRTVFRSAMTVRLLPQAGARRGFTREDFEPLRRHYEERNFQIHVMHEYGVRGTRKINDALSLVAAYFSTAREFFVKENFAGRKELLEFATTADSYRRIVDALNHPIQQRLVQARESANHLVLAGPGAGKTKLIVHRVAYLLRVLRLPAESIIVLTFNRASAIEVRRRLFDLVGADAAGVTVLTYHAMALRLMGASLSAMDAVGAEPDFDEIVRRAILLLEGQDDSGLDADELRDRLLRGYRFILVDEYQDIDALQYQLVSALAGRTRQEGDSKLSIMAVGDDDQNVYSFRKTSVEFIRRFEEDYKAATTYLVENFRSTQHIITAANDLIQGAPDRMKTDHPIRINHARRNDLAGGRWSSLDPVAQGRVQVVRTPLDRNIQAQLAMRELERLRALDPSFDLAGVAIIARTHRTLEPLRAYCEVHGVPYRTGDRGGEGGQLSVVKTREGHRVLSLLNRRRRRMVRTGALARWLTKGFQRESGNPWLEQLVTIAQDMHTALGGARVPAPDAIDWIYESAAGQAREAPGHLNLLTAHGAKGREFEHVFVLDGGDWKSTDAEERRLYYVAMTRAKATLNLFRAGSNGNLFVDRLDGSDAVFSVAPKIVPVPDVRLNRLYRGLSMRDFDLGYAGRSPSHHLVHSAIDGLRYGDRLEIAGGKLQKEGVVVGKLSKSCSLPQGQIFGVSVSAIVVRSVKQSDPNYQPLCKVDAWETVLCDVAIDPQ